jgi:hypothetical protein
MFNKLSVEEDFNLWIDYDEVMCEAVYIKKLAPSLSADELIQDILSGLSDKYGVSFGQIELSLTRYDEYLKKASELINETLSKRIKD